LKEKRRKGKKEGLVWRKISDCRAATLSFGLCPGWEAQAQETLTEEIPYRKSGVRRVCQPGYHL
jgi:hypothetical protein